MDYINIIGLAAAAMGGISLFPPITVGFKDQIYQRHFSWNDFNIFRQHIFVARLWNLIE